MRASDSRRLATLSDQIAARLAGRGSVSDARISPGLPRSIGSVGRGEALLAGQFRIGGRIVDAPREILWDVLPNEPVALREAHGFAWLDDLAAVPTQAAQGLAQAWTRSWIARFGDGRGPGWTADLAGRRALRLVHHAESMGELPLAPSLARHAAFLSRRAVAAQPGLAQVEALTGLVHAGLALDPDDDRVVEALSELEPAVDALINREGGVVSRNPEALARALLLLGWTAEVAAARRATPGPALVKALARGGAVLRGLVQPDGRLPRFHGGAASFGLADAALSMTAPRRTAGPAMLAMGFARLRHGRTGIIVDVARPPTAASDTGHASTLALEVTVGQRPLIVNCGPGHRFGPRWGRAARATASHSTLSLDGFSSSRFGRDGLHMTETPEDVHGEFEGIEDGTRLVCTHDGYVSTHGLVHERTVELLRDGRRLRGADSLVAPDATARRRFDRIRQKSGPPRYAVRFHLDPEVEASLDMGGHAVSLLLPSGALWVFRVTAGAARLALEPSVVFPADANEPGSTQQLVLFSSADEYATRVAWDLAEVPGARSPARDIERQGKL